MFFSISDYTGTDDDSRAMLAKYLCVDYVNIDHWAILKRNTSHLYAVGKYIHMHALILIAGLR